MKSNFISLTSDCLTINKREYATQLSFSSSRIRQDKRIEDDMKQEYSGRELYEMLQNADDEGSPKVEIILTEDDRLHIRNWGDRPFTEGGLLSIMRSFLSTKTGDAYKNATIKPIGNKGLGFRSLLNWSDEITIHSNGVKCSFSEDIAKNAWNDIKNTGRKEGTLSEDDLSNFEGSDNQLPIPILSIPEFISDDLTSPTNPDHYTTDIEVHCKDKSIVWDVEQKLNSLPCSVLLFLRNIKEIVINCKGVERHLLAKSESQDEYHKVIIQENGKNIEFIVSQFKKEGDYEIGIAYPLNKSYASSVLYSYFPTQVSLSSPGIYHGTFALNASRNHLVKSDKNDEVLAKMGELAIKLASYLAEKKLLTEKWDAVELINLRKSETDAAMLLPLAKEIKRGFSNATIFPSVGSGYVSLGNSVWIGEKMSEWLQVHDQYQADLCSHLIHYEGDLFSEERILGSIIKEQLVKRMDEHRELLETVAGATMKLNTRADLIDSIVDAGECERKISILVDNQDKIINADKSASAYVLNMAGNTDLPECLNIKAVSSGLIKILQAKWALRTTRDVTDRLCKIAYASDGDITAIRRRIESWSSSEMNIKGMKDVFRWMYKNHNDRTSFSSSLNLFNRNEERRPACSLILGQFESSNEATSSLLSKIDNCWFLIDTIQDWIKTLEAESENDAVEFILNVMGVSRLVPVEHIYFGEQNDDFFNTVRDENNRNQISNWYCNNFGYENKTSKEHNYSYVPIKGYFDKFTLSESIGLLMKDNRAYSNILDNTIRLSSRKGGKVKSESVLYSFAAYKIRSYQKFVPLQQHVINSTVFCADIDYSVIQTQFGLDKINIDPFLIILGAHKDSSDFSIEQLFEFLATKGEARGIQKRYKELRESIRSKHIEDNVLAGLRNQYIKYVWAKKNGTIEWLPVEDVYYWDNDQLPRKVLDSLPKLEIGTRVGEESVKQIFGVKLAKDIEISFQNTSINEDLTASLKKFLSERLKYFLAYRICDDVKNEDLIRSSLNALKQICNNLHVFNSTCYCLNGESQQMEDGDILTSRDVQGNAGLQYYICSSKTSCSEAILNPAFSENLNNVVCMALKITGDTMANYFRNIITHDISYIEYIRKKDISLETWSLTLKSIGLSLADQKFWRAYSAKQGTKLRIESLSEHLLDQRTYILQTYPNLLLPEDFTSIDNLDPSELYKLVRSTGLKDCSKLLNHDGLKEYYRMFFDSAQHKYAAIYGTILYKETKDAICRDKASALSYIRKYQDEYRRRCTELYQEKLEKIKFEVLQDEDLDKIIIKLIEDKFGKLPNDDIEPIPTSIFPSYEKILTEYHMSEGTLSQEDALIGKFEGLEDLFRERLKAYDNDGSEISGQQTNSEETQFILEIGKCHSVYKDIKVTATESKTRTADGYASDKTKYRAGKKAEIATFETMCRAKDKYDDVQGCSTILNKENGNDKLHYDIKYHRVGDLPANYRYLEVKSMSGNSIIMSNLEYEFAKANSEIYDFAIVHEGKISIIETPFGASRGSSKFQVQPESYLVNIEWEE